MAGDVTVIAGIPIPSTSPVFLAVVGFHVLVGTISVVTGAVAMLSRKGRGRHSDFGTLYFWALVAVFASSSGLALARWAENYPLLILGAMSMSAAYIGRSAIRHGRPTGVRTHIVGMGVSYIALLTAFYVDNGKNLPIWRVMPQLAFWLLPGVIGLPIIGYVLLRHPLARRSPGVRKQAARVDLTP